MPPQRWSAWLLLAIVAATAVVVTAQAPQPAFEVASIKRAAPGETGGRVQFLAGGRFVGTNVSLDFVLQQVYGVRPYQIIAGPEWKAIVADGYGNRYHIQAKAADESVSTPALKEMVKSLLADRFSLRLHKEMRDLPVYALGLARSGVKGAHALQGQPGGIEFVANGWIRGQRIPIDRLVEVLSSYINLDRPVINRTNLDQVLDFDLTWTPLTVGAATDVAAGSECPADFTTIAERRNLKVAFTCPAIFTAVQDQLGLRLDPQLAPVEALVIDSVQRPTEN